MPVKRILNGLVLIFIVSFIVTVFPAQSQDIPTPSQRMQGEIRGIVVDDATKQPLPSATVAIWNVADSSLVTGAVTLQDGTFSIGGLRPGTYYARISYVGYETITVSDVHLAEGSMQAILDEVRLPPDTSLLDEVEVAAEREFIEVGIDRTVYNTRDQLVSAGGSVSDVLENIPSVEVDIDGNISLRGSQNVAILINGRPSLMTGTALISYLQGLPSDAVERIEVIPNPSAKYEPDGMAGILNLVLKQNRDPGLTGSLTASAAIPSSYNASGNLAYQKNRFGFFAGYGYRYSSRDNKDWRFRENRSTAPSTILDQQSVGVDIGYSHNLNASVDYKPGRRSTVTLASMLSVRSGDDSGLAAYSEMDAPDLLTSRYDRETLEDGKDVSFEKRLSYSYIIDPGSHELSVELNYEHEKEREAGLYSQSVYDVGDPTQTELFEQQSDIQTERNKEVALQLDYTRPLGSDIELELGFKSDVEQLDHVFYAESLNPTTSLFVPEAQLNNTFVYDMRSHAAYGIMGSELGRFSLKAGARLEQAFTTFTLGNTQESFDNNYFSIFPSAFVVYEFSTARSLRLSYSKRINRPDEWQLNPFDSNEEPLFKRLGNPFLKPEYIHAYEVSYTQFAGATSLTLTPYFRRTVDEIRRYETLREDGVTVLTFENFNTSDSWGVELIGTFNHRRGLNAYASLNAYQVVTDGSNVDSDLSNNAFGLSARANATYSISPSMDVQFSYYYRAPMDIENGRQFMRQSVDLAVRQKLMGDRAHLSLRVRDLFNTMGFHVVREDVLYLQEINRAPRSQSIGLSFTYNFGNMQNRQSGDDQDEEGMGIDIDEMEMQ